MKEGDCRTMLHLVQEARLLVYRNPWEGLEEKGSLVSTPTVVIQKCRAEEKKRHKKSESGFQWKKYMQLHGP